MSGFLTHDEAVARLKSHIADFHGSQSAFARHLGICPQFVNFVCTGRRKICPKIAAAIGLVPGFQLREPSKGDAA
jgi:DNA-binding transcriptional regulator YdaS (Cro superfamily)